jgi:hypothetical protein
MAYNKIALVRLLNRLPAISSRVFRCACDDDLFGEVGTGILQWKERVFYRLSEATHAEPLLVAVGLALGVP